MKTNTQNLNLLPFCHLFVSMEMAQLFPTHALSHAGGMQSMRTHLSAVGLKAIFGNIRTHVWRYAEEGKLTLCTGSTLEMSNNGCSNLTSASYSR